MKWMDRVWALLVLAAAAVLVALLCGHIIGATQARTENSCRIFFGG